MSGVRVLVGTRKGAFILTSDQERAKWDVSGPHFAGWEIYHIKGSPADPNRLYASQSSGWFGQVMQRSDDGGKTWEAVGKDFVYDGTPGTHQWYDGTQHPWEFKRVWHLEPSLTDPDTVYAGVEDAALFRSTDAGQTWQELPALRAAISVGQIIADARQCDGRTSADQKSKRSTAHATLSRYVILCAPQPNQKCAPVQLIGRKAPPPRAQPRASQCRGGKIRSQNQAHQLRHKRARGPR